VNIGKIYLVGAGPGDPTLITQKGLECLARADVVIYDHLLDERLLDAARPDAEKIYVGKSGAEHAKEQSDINQLLVAKAKEGKVVVRLKGGDPFVFGRGGEESETLVENHIPFEIVPGVTSAVAVPAYAGIPVTHRGLASSFAVVTGHEGAHKEISSINWEKLATGVDTLVFLMGMQNLPLIATKLVENGRPDSTPVAVIKDGTHPEQKTVVGTLKDIVRKVKAAGLGAPAIIVVGEVAGLREKLRWFDNRPLSGKKVLVTRARHQASALSRLLLERGAQAVEIPVLSIQPVSDMTELDHAILKISDYKWIIFTSTNGVEAFFRRLHYLKRDARALHGASIAAIGPATAQALQERGIHPDFCPEVFTTEGIISVFTDKDISGQRFLLPRTDIADKQLTEALQRLSAIVDEVTVYQTVPVLDAPVKETLASGEIDVITFTSSSTVSNLMAAIGNDKALLKGMKTACIGPKTAATARKAGLKVDITAHQSTIPGLVAALEEYFSKEAN